ncbi:DNA polymerase [Dapis sp. BLCC M229]|uniref:DNA polymerase n=1 Tax=Dapis sp. BLCC M229 TaxID=3400188 RepID=UPI003CE6D414
MSANPPTTLLIDGHSLAFRSYYAFAKSRSGGLKTSTGIPTSVCFGFLKSLLEVIETQKPEYLAIAFDLGEPTFRHKADENYKADRPEPPEDLITDLENLQELLRAFNLTVITAPGYEADDILGTLAQKASAAGFGVKILSGDQDLFQLIDVEKGISVLHLAAGKGSTPKEFFSEEVKEKLGIFPNQVVDYKALCGDKSDNIPGVRGIGEKTAVKLLNEYGCLAEIYASLDKIKGANQKKLVVGKAEAEHSQFMAKIEVNVPLNIDIEDCQVKRFSRSEIEPVLQRLELQHFLNQIPNLEQQFNGLVGIKSLSEESESQEQEKSTNSLVEVGSDDWFFSAEDTKVAQQEISTKSEIKPQIIDTREKLKELVNILKEQKNSQTPVAWDTETTSLEPRDAELVGVGCCWGKNIEDVAYIPTGHKIGKNLDKVTLLEALKPVLESAEHPKVFQNAKFDRLVFRCQGIKLAGVVFDTMLASYVLNPGAKHSLEEIYIRYLTNKGINLQSYNDVVSKNQTIADLDILKVADYCGTQVFVTFQLVEKLRAELEKADKNQSVEKSLYKLLVDVEQPLEAVLAEMEFQGIKIDIESLKKLSLQLQKDGQKNQVSEKSLQRLLVDLEQPLEAVLAEMEFQGIRIDIESLKKLSSQLQKDGQKNQSAEKSLYKLLVDVEQPLEAVLAEMEFQGIKIDIESLKKLSSQLQKDRDKNQPPEKSLYKLLVDVEQPLESVLAKMEFQGIRIDIEYLKKFSIQLKQDLEEIEKRACQTVDSRILQEHLQTEIHKIDPNSFTNQQELKKAISSPILKAYISKLSKDQRENLATLENQIDRAETRDLLNLNSPSQLSELLFEILHQNKKKSRRLKTGYSTDVVVLEKLQTEPEHHPIIDEILNHRTLYKLFSTYVEAIPKLVRSDTQRVHTNFNQTQTDTGRLSSSEPNLQNIPIGTEFSRQIRQAFLPKKDWLLVAADYSQIELRILAHLSQEPVLIEAYQNNQDVHTVTAKLLFEKAEISPEERRVGKTINFGVIYGMGAQKLARSVKITVKESKQFLERYKQQYSQVFAYLERLKKQAIAKGYVETILGRRRYFEFESKTLRDLKGKQLKEINLRELKLSQNDAQILRAAANSPIQGSSADIIKIAMIKLNKILTNYQTKLLLQVHDELVFEVPPLESEELQQVIKFTMENAVNLKVPLIVDIHGGKNWMETK